MKEFNFDPDIQESLMEGIKLIRRVVSKDSVFDVALSFYTSKFSKSIRRAGLDGMEHACFSTPDIDNLSRGRINKVFRLIGVDDRRIFRLLSQKFYSSKPRTEMTIRIF